MGSSHAPKAYKPTAQPQMDQNYQQAYNQQMPWASALPGEVIPGLQQVASNVQNNPYYGQAQAGAQQAANTALQSVAPMDLGNANVMTGFGNAAQGATGAATSGAQYANPLFQQAQSFIPSTTAGAGMAGNAMGQATAMSNPSSMAQLMQAFPALFQGMTNANQTYNTDMGAIPGLTQGMGAANSILNTAFDPQQSLYNRMSQQTTDSSNAINAMYGLSSSGYGAGQASDAMKNFNIDWQNNQLGRQISGLGAYGQEQGNIANIYEGLTGAAANNYGQLSNDAYSQFNNTMNSANQNYLAGVNSGVGNFNSLASGAANNLATLQGSGTNAFNSMMGGAVNNLSTLANTAGQSYGQAAGLGASGLNTIQEATALPSQTYLQQQQSWMDALQNLSAGGSSSLQPLQAMTGQAGNYLQLGQNATKINQNAAQIDAANNPWSGIGKLVGTVAPMFFGVPPIPGA